VTQTPEDTAIGIFLVSVTAIESVKSKSIYAILERPKTFTIKG
jgi:hypothetical protein